MFGEISLGIKRPFIVWVITKIVLLPIWIWLGFLINAKAGIVSIIIAALYQVSDLWNQYLIGKVIRDLALQIRRGSLSKEEKERNLSKIRQLAVKRNIFSAANYFFERAGFGRVPKHSVVHHAELLDFAPYWVRQHVLKTMAKLSWLPFLGFLPPVQTTIKKTVRNGEVYVGLDLGSGLGEFLEMLAKWCRKKKLPAVLIGLELQPCLIDEASKRMRKHGFEVIIHPGGMVNTDELSDRARKSMGPVICLICDNASNAPDLFRPGTIILTQMVHAKHHLEGITELIEKNQLSKYWLVLEEYRTWNIFLLIWGFYWFWSRVLICDGEDSILVMHTKEEWEAMGVRVITRIPWHLWAMSKELFDDLQKKT